MLWKAQLAAAPGIVNMLQQSMEYNVSVCVCVTLKTFIGSRLSWNRLQNTKHKQHPREKHKYYKFKTLPVCESANITP